MIEGFIVVQLWSDREHLDNWNIYDTKPPQVYAIRKFNSNARYKNVIKSLTHQIKTRYEQFMSLTPSEFEELFTINVYKFTKHGWPMEVGELRDYLR